MLIERKKYINLIDRIVNLWKSIFFVWSRQVWKTTLMKMYCEMRWLDYFYINFDEIVWVWRVEFNNLNQFLQELNFYYKKDILQYDLVIFDEVSKVKNFNVFLKALIDKYPQKIFFASSSGNYDFVDSILEGLAGRIIKIEVFPFDFEEFLQAKWVELISVNSERSYNLVFPYLQEYLIFGGYPEVVLQSDFENKKIILKSIVDSIFEKDLINFVKLEKILDLKQLMKYLRRNLWSLFSFEGLANDLGLKIYDVKYFIKILERSYLLYLLSPFWTSKKIEVSTKMKIYLNDFGIYNFVLNNFEDFYLDWSLVEQFVFLQLRYNLDITDEIYFYRKINWSEIDFILEKWWKLIPIEVKLGNKVKIPKIFVSFAERYGDKVKYFVKTTKWLVDTKDIDGIPVKFLSFLNIKEVLE